MAAAWPIQRAQNSRLFEAPRWNYPAVISIVKISDAAAFARPEGLDDGL